MPITDAVTVSYHPELPTSSLTFTMERPVDDRIPFIRIEIIKNEKDLETQIYRKSTITGFLLLLYSRTGKRYNDSLLNIALMLYVPQQRHSREKYW